MSLQLKFCACLVTYFSGAAAVSLAPGGSRPDFPGPRTGPLVAGIGFGHTSTTSLASALRQLGLRTKHWAPQYTLKLMCLKMSGGKKPEPGEKLNENVSIDDAVKNFEWGWQALNETDAILDEPVNVFWEHIYKRFPDTKFILTKRNVSLWAESEFTWYDHDSHDRMKSTERFKPYWRWCKKYDDVDCQDKLLEYSFGSRRPTKQNVIDAFNAHVEKVRKTIPADQLLEMDISSGDGFDKLAPFLGKHVPKRKHETKEFPHDCNGHCIHPATSLRGSARHVALTSSGRTAEEEHDSLCRCNGANGFWLQHRLPISSELIEM